MKKRLLKAIFGIFLIFSGIAITLGNLGIIRSVDFLWDILFILLGGYLFYIGARKQVLFEGLLASFLTTVGLVGFFYELDILAMGISSLWPAMFLVMGIYVLLTFSKKHSKLLLGSGVFMVLFGSVIILKRFGILVFSFRDIISKIWPIVLILLGIYFMKGLVQKQQRTIF